MKYFTALFALLLSLLFTSRLSAAAGGPATDADLAFDAVSKFAQIGSHRCHDLRKQVLFLEATSSTDGEHTEANFTFKLRDQTYKVLVIDGVVMSVSRKWAAGDA
jgi:hypothetical protein